MRRTVLPCCFKEATTRLYRSTFRVNTATDGGGGIYASNAVTLTQSPVVSNTAGGAGGGGIYANNAVTLTGSPVISNTATNGSGGGISGGQVTPTTRPGTHNTAGSRGGGNAHAGAPPNNPRLSIAPT